MLNDDTGANRGQHETSSEEDSGGLEDRGIIGFGRPPVSTRFKKGTSGNPKGRPKGSLNVSTAITKALRERVVINEHGQRKTVTKLQAALKQLANKAAAGDLRAVSQVLELASEVEVKQNSSAQSHGPGLSELDQEVMNGILKRFNRDGSTSTASNQDKPECR